jgi:DNA-binding CsgD family transcriptional regulator
MELQELSGWAVLQEEDPRTVIAAARAAALGMAVIPARGPEIGREEAGAVRGGGVLHELGPLGGPWPSESTDRNVSAVDLTGREMDVLRLVAEGATNQEVASALRISENTVKYHLGSLFAKLDVTRRSEMTFEAIRKGLITV